VEIRLRPRTHEAAGAACPATVADAVPVPLDAALTFCVGTTVAVSVPVPDAEAETFCVGTAVAVAVPVPEDDAATPALRLAGIWTPAPLVLVIE